MNYADIDTLHAYGGFTHPTEEGDALLELFISTASTIIDNYWPGRVYGIPDAQAAVPRAFTKDNGLLPRSGRTLWLYDDLCSTPTFAEVPAPTVTLIPRNPPYYRIVRTEGTWPDPTVITGHWAYSMTPPIPITLLCLRLAKWLYEQRESTDSDRPIMADGMIIMPNRLPKDVAVVMAGYKPVRVG